MATWMRLMAIQIVDTTTGWQNYTSYLEYLDTGNNKSIASWETVTIEGGCISLVGDTGPGMGAHISSDMRPAV